MPMLRQQQQQQQPLAHHAVVRTAEDEARLPEELRNNFYKDPRIAEGLAKSSWFTPGEEQICDVNWPPMGSIEFDHNNRVE
ncbi:hypothetical protein FOCC_FOCC007444 [Frankliniella occidentalis]|nr:hypothetical protein FOCC_FOCC007444 [Frankliniella occidentalis]